MTLTQFINNFNDLYKHFNVTTRIRRRSSKMMSPVLAVLVCSRK